MFSWSRKACFLYKLSKIVFSRLIFSIYFMGIHGGKRGEKGLQEVTRSERGLQGVAGVYKRWEGVTKGYWRLQRMKENLFSN